ncbi:MAG: hypothetical protein DI582_10265 [Azospirillum brasilense]|nr:MAG: hypothetical protein DI582_10265 [Azospirillum brasilense]
MNVTFDRRVVLHTLHHWAQIAYVVFGLAVCIGVYLLLHRVDPNALLDTSEGWTANAIDFLWIPARIALGFAAGMLAWAIPHDLDRAFSERRK